MRPIPHRFIQPAPWILADEVYLGAEMNGPRTDQLLGGARAGDA